MKISWRTMVGALAGAALFGGISYQLSYIPDEAIAKSASTAPYYGNQDAWTGSMVPPGEMTKDKISGKMSNCDYLIRNFKPDYAPDGYDISCVGLGSEDILKYKNSGMSYFNPRRIEIVRGYDATFTTAVLYHEYGHAEANEVLTTKAWNYFNKRIGYNGGNDYFHNPHERWASTRARCAGYPQDKSYPLTDCAIIDETLKVAHDDFLGLTNADKQSINSGTPDFIKSAVKNVKSFAAG